VLTALCGVGVVLGVGAALSVAVGPSALFPVVAEGPGQLRAAGPFGEPNFFALSLAAIVPAALVLVGRSPARTVLGVAALAAIAAGILATGSRGAGVAAIVGLLATAATGDRGSRRAGLVLLLCAAAATPLFSTQLGGAEERTTSGRQTENRIALAMAADHPLLGVGAGGYPGLYRDYGRRLGSDPRSDRAPHSLPLEIAAEQGLVGVACWGVALALVVGALRRARGIPAARTLALCLGTYAVGSLFLHGSQLRLPYLLAGLALALAASTRAGREAGGEARPAREATA
jgi:O-antigen ligase